MAPATAPPSRRIGLFGGAFDPPHNAHVALARAAVQQLALDALHIVPTGQAWHKARKLSQPAHRLAMAQLAFQDLPRVVVDDRELVRSGPSFTIDTLQQLQAEDPPAQLYLFIGADQFASFRQWHQWKRITGIAIICIATRAQPICANAHFDSYFLPQDRVFYLDFPSMPVSATRVRELVSQGADSAISAADLVPAPVARYIATHRLYTPG